MSMILESNEAIMNAKPRRSEPSTIDHAEAIPLGDDPRGFLPSFAREHLAQLESDAMEAAAANGHLLDRVQELQAEASRLAGIVTDFQRRHVDREFPDRYAAATADLARARNELETVMRRRAERHAPLNDMAQLVARLKGYVAGLKIRPVSFDQAIRLPSDKAPIAVIGDARKRIAELTARIVEVRDAPIPAAAAKLAARREIERLARDGAPSFTMTRHRGAPIVWPARLDRGAVALPEPTTDTLAILAWVHADALIASAERAIDEEAKRDGRPGLSDAERKRALTDARADLLAAERLEEMAIRAIEATGGTFARRVRADPRAVLDRADHMPEPSA